MKQYKLQELIGHTKKLPREERLFYESLVNFRKLPECSQLFKTFNSHGRGGRELVKKGTKVRKQFQFSKSRPSSHEEEPQSYAEWKVFMSMTRLSSWKLWRRLNKSNIYILPVGPFPDDLLSNLVSSHWTLLQTLRSFAESFFPGIDFKFLPMIEHNEFGCKTRIHKETGQLQLLISGKYSRQISNTFLQAYSTGCSQHNTDFAKTNQNEVVRIRTNFFEDFRIRKLIRENEFMILNL